MTPAVNLMTRMRNGAAAAAYGNPVYQKMLAALPAPSRLHFTLPDLWPGDAQAGLQLIGAQGALFSPLLPQHPAAVLRNLRAVGTDAARHMSLRLIGEWLTQHDHWNSAEWSAAQIGERIAGWIGCYEFYAPAARPDTLSRIAASLQRQHRHLIRSLPPKLTGLGNLQAIKGLIWGGLNFADGDKALGLAAAALQRQLTTEILPDGGVVQRSPSAQLHMLRALIDIRAALKAADIAMPDGLRPAINLMVPALKFFRHGDGGLSLFHGGREETPLLVDAVITHAEGRSRILRRLPDTGFEKLTAGRSLLIADCARPPARGYDQHAHAGLGSFEFGYSRERLIVNCGAAESAHHPPDAHAAWYQACAATAAHSTLTFGDTNACQVLAHGGIAGRLTVTAQRFELDGAQCIEITHDGYQSTFGITHQRTLSLSPDGEALYGREVLTGETARKTAGDFALRWHLHPGVQVALDRTGMGALLKTAGGSGWRLRVEGAQLTEEASIYCGHGAPRASRQLKMKGQIRAARTTVLWSLVREKKI